MSILDINAAANAIKQRYLNPKFVADIVYPDNPLFALLKKQTDAGGQNWKFPVRIATTAGASSVFANAQTNVTASNYQAYQVTRVTKYGYGSISGEAIRAGKGSENTFVDLLTNEINGAMLSATRAMAIDLYRNGGGARGQISSTSAVGTPTITLANIADITNFEPGMVLQVSADDGTGGGGVRTGTVTISKVNGNTGTITCTGNWSAGIAAVAVNDFIFQQGDYNACCAGLGAWLLTTAPAGGDNFFGVNRSVFPNRLAGVTFSGNGAPMEEVLVDTAARLVREGGKPDHLMVNPIDWANLVKALGSKVFYEEARPTDTAKVGFRVIRFDAPSGPVKIVADLNCPAGKSFLLTLSNWELASAGDAPSILDDDGRMLLRDPNTDSYSFRVGSYYNLVCSKGAPGWNASIVW
jgi:hypothetical protein